MAKASKRTYRRRTDAERLAELEQKLAEVKGRVERQKRPDKEVIDDIKHVCRRLAKLVKKAQGCGREDIATTTQAFIAGLKRISEEGTPPRR